MKLLSCLLLIYLGLFNNSLYADTTDNLPQYLSSSFSGTYQGLLKIVVVPDAFKNKVSNIEYKVVIGQKETTLFIKETGQEWEKAGSAAHVLDNSQMVTAFYNSRSGFIEYWSISLIRIGENSAQAYIMRTVNNFALDPENEMHHFYMVSEGELN